LKATGATKDEQKRALLLHVAGEEVQDIIETLDNTGTKYDQAVAALSDYFKPRKHISFERHVFRHAKQKEDETIDNFVRTFHIIYIWRLELFGIPSHNVHFGHNDSIALFDG
jgi:hypothetical protein